MQRNNVRAVIGPAHIPYYTENKYGGIFCPGLVAGHEAVHHFLKRFFVLAFGVNKTPGLLVAGTRRPVRRFKKCMQIIIRNALTAESARAPAIFDEIDYGIFCLGSFDHDTNIR